MDDKTIDQFKFVFSSESGKKVLEEISKFTYENEDNFCKDNERLNAYNQGRRSVILFIRNFLIQRKDN